MGNSKVMIFDPSYGTKNMGDSIIVESCLEQLEEYTKDKFLIRVSTHQPLYHFHQVYGRNLYSKLLSEVDNTFVLGSNLLNKDLLITRKRPWNIHFWSTRNINNAVLVGVGSNGAKGRNTLYTRMLYKKVLSKDLIHSVRDQETCDYVASLGLKVLNTGCATMWDLTPEHCKSIKTKKSKNVVFTLTDYKPDVELDTFLIKTLIEEYSNVYFWPQGSEDRAYIAKLGIDSSKVIMLNSDLNSYREILKTQDIDYVGSRLHGGIFALQHKVRTLIVAVDHRALNKKEDYNLPVIERETCKSTLKDLINSEFETIINLDFDKINTWKNQFK